MTERGRAVVAPLALAQFIASYAATTMTVSISAIAADLGTTVAGVQTTITLFTLTMAALMVPGSRLTDVLGRKACFVGGLVVYGAGALLAALAPGPWLMTLGYSVLEGVGSALMIPPIYILVTVLFDDLAARARNFGVVSAAGGLGAAAGPLIGGLVTSGVGWRASFLLQVAVVVVVLVWSRRVTDPVPRGPRPRFDVRGAVLSAAGLALVVIGVLGTGAHGWSSWRVWSSVGLGVVVLWCFSRHVRACERAGRDPLCPSRVFRDLGSNLGLVTQLVQWLVLQGAFFVVSVYLQQVRGLDAIGTGLVLLPATAGVLLAAAVAERAARGHPQRRLIRIGFAATVAGVALLLALVRKDTTLLSFVPGLLVLGAGLGTMLTASVTLVQSAWPPDAQGAISGVSRSASNLGASLGTALAGSVVAGSADGRTFAAALAVLGGVAVAGFGVALLLPRRSGAQPS
ncbi:MFS transporter [Saccharothrix syringae]|uniref:MFS transporter n=1 Tax=Saccharothrix syringae TaxID=103733 RepID=A0A5Q0H074_SACSY|nr:MFS transporter [Saccharothrix syringae]QFZ19651.1 MFS transporter [Saccharothrix syringae]